MVIKLKVRNIATIKNPVVQNKVTHDLKSRLDYYKIWNPIYNDYNYTIL